MGGSTSFNQPGKHGPTPILSRIRVLRHLFQAMYMLIGMRDKFNGRCYLLDHGYELPDEPS
jgi:hypothetical protein